MARAKVLPLSKNSVSSHPVSIRAAILRGSWLLVLVAILLSGSLSFFEFRQALQAEIARNLGNSAGALQDRLDTFLFERREDLREWHRLELLQDIRIGDVDKRLARLLSDLKAGHGDVYGALYCTNRDGRVVAASTSALIGRIRPPGAALNPDAADVVMERTRLDSSGEQYVLRADIADAFGSGRLGYLYAVLNWDAVRRFLRDDVRGSARTALLLGGNGEVLAAAGPLAPPPASRPISLAGWYGGVGTHGEIRSGAPLSDGDVLVGMAASGGDRQFPGFGWHTLVVESTRVAFAPVWHLAWAILGGLLSTLAIAGWLSLRLSARITGPIGRLTEFARRFRQTREKTPPRLETGISEVGELGRAFAAMIEDLEHSREQLVRAGKLAVVGEMAAIMAHEVRTPLGILKTSAQLLQRKPDLSAEEQELTGYIVSETDRLNRLVTTLLECASPRLPEFQPRDLHEILEHVLGLVGGKAEKSGIHLEARLAAKHSILACDREQMIQVFLNLIINAIQHLPGGDHTGGRIRVVSGDADGGVVVRVEDDGPGIPEADAAKVFDPFFTRREGGIGLGLTIVQQIVQAHGGEITVGRGDLGGACFTVRFQPENQGEQN
jgi:two-component system sensor histidine kinase HydH